MIVEQGTGIQRIGSREIIWRIRIELVSLDTILSIRGCYSSGENTLNSFVVLFVHKVRGEGMW